MDNSLSYCERKVNLYRLITGKQCHQEHPVSTAIPSPFGEFVQAILESHSENAIDLQVAIQLAVVARFYERIGDHAVNIGERVRYLVTGWLPEHKGAARFRQKSGEDDTDGIPFFPNKES